MSASACDVHVLSISIHGRASVPVCLDFAACRRDPFVFVHSRRQLKVIAVFGCLSKALFLLLTALEFLGSRTDHARVVTVSWQLRDVDHA